MIAIENVCKSYGAFTALADVDLSIAAGEKVVICGPSGSGKSTLIRCVNGLETFDRGRIAVAGTEIGRNAASLLAARRTVGMVFQRFSLFPHLTVLDNCTLAPRIAKGIGRAEARERAMQLLGRVHIADQADKFPHQLSGGQQQRVAIARALCMEPTVMLFDEPTSALDPEMIGEVLDVMAELAATGMTMICVTHEMSFARRVADRIVFMDKGRIVETNTPAAFFSSPETPRARAFLAQLLH